MPLELQIIIASALPVTELRGAIPWFVATHPELSAWYVYWWAVIGNLLPVAFLLWFLPKFTDFVHKNFPAHNVIKRAIDWVYKKSHAKHGQKFYRYGSLALILIVALPLPGTGGWTGSLLAFLFNIKYWKALWLIAVGVVIAGIIVTLLSQGGVDLFHSMQSR
jgi:uncharacterized membrane protein